jgi:hypothetical protein
LTSLEKKCDKTFLIWVVTFHHGKQKVQRICRARKLYQTVGDIILDMAMLEEVDTMLHKMYYFIFDTV